MPHEEKSSVESGSSKTTSPAILGETKQRIDLSSSSDHQRLTLEMAQQAKQSIKVVSYDLDPRVYDTQALEQALTEFATRNRYTQIQIVVISPDTMVKRGHRLLELARRITTHMAIRIPGKMHKDMTEAFSLFDGEGYLYREYPTRYEGHANFYDVLRVKELTSRFNDIWEMGLEDPQLRRLHI